MQTLQINGASLQVDVSDDMPLFWVLPPLNPEIENRAKLAVKELDIKPESNLRWGENKLGGGLLRPGQTISINEFTEANCKYQMRAVFQDGRTEERPVDICRHSRMVLGEHQQ
jgi:hypothetical protein